MHEDGRDLEGIEQELTDHDPALVAAFRKWEVPAGVQAVPAGATTVPPWALAVFATAAVSWVVSPGFGVLVAVTALLSALLDGLGRRRDRLGRLPSSGGGAPAAPTGGGDRDNDSGWPPHTWRNGWM